MHENNPKTVVDLKRMTRSAWALKKRSQDLRDPKEIPRTEEVTSEFLRM